MLSYRITAGQVFQKTAVPIFPEWLLFWNWYGTMLVWF
jgi:hypothetical protein